MHSRSLLGIYGISGLARHTIAGGWIQQDVGLESYMAMLVGLVGSGVGSQGKAILYFDCFLLLFFFLPRSWSMAMRFCSRTFVFHVNPHLHRVLLFGGDIFKPFLPALKRSCIVILCPRENGKS